MTVRVFIQSIVNGLSLGSLYALLAIGYSVVYGILQFINFAHGDIFMMAAYIPIYAVLLLSLPWPASFLVAILLTAILGISVDRIAYRPLRKAPKMSSLVSSIGVSFFLQNSALLVFGGRPKGAVVPEIFSQSYTFAGISLPSIAIYTVIAVIISLLFLYYVVYRTKAGLAMRALSEDLEIAGLMGININRTISVAFAIGSGLAAVGAILWTLRFPVVRPILGLVPGMKAFIAAVVGGVGNIPGAIVGGLLLGFGEVMLVAIFPRLSGYRDVFSFVILTLILLIKPTGLLGARVREEKM